MPPTFAHPEYLLFGLLATALAGLFFYATEKRAWRRLTGFAESALLERLTQSHSRRRQWLKNGLLMSVILLVFAGLARPQWGANWEKAETRGIDIMIALDTSRSMLAEDISPNRLDRSKLAILDLLGTLRGDRIGLIAFAGNAFLQCPLTLDYQAFRQTLSAIDTETIPVGGTDIAAAIDEAEAYFEQSGNERILILITDGEDLEASGLQQASESAGKGMRILTIGVGSTRGELIPVRGPAGVDYLRDATGKPVSTSLDEETLRQIAALSNGVYAPLGPTGAGLARAYEFCLAQLPAAERKESLQRIPIERFQWVLLLAVLLLVVETLVSTRRATGPGMENRLNLILLGLTSLSLVSLGNPLEAGPASDAYKAYKEGRFEESGTLYAEAVSRDPEDARLIYNMGDANYRSGKFAQAIANFETALRLAQPGLQEKIFHNSGNSRVALGFDSLEENSQQTLAQWEAALTDFENALALDESRSTSRQNLDLTREAIASHTYQLTILADPEAGGTVTPGTTIFHNIPLRVEAKANEGYVFNEWTGDVLEDPTKASTTARLKADATITASFVKTWNLTVLSEDQSMGTAGTSGTYREDQPVKIKAEASEYFAFSKWSSEELELQDPSQAETEINLTSDATITASFVPAFKLSVKLDPEIAGKAGNSGFYEEYSVVPIQAEPRPGFEWENWVGDGIKDPGQPQTTVSLTKDRIAVAKMKRIWNLVIVPDPEEGGSVEGAGDYPVGSQVEISATPAEGFTFAGWEGPGVANPDEPRTSVTVQSEEHTLFARFQQDQNQNQDQDQEDNQQQEQDPGEPDNQDESGEQPEDQSGEQPPGDEQPPDEEQDPSQPQSSGEEEQQPQPGEMTREEARQLLNALSENEKFLPAGEISDDKRRQPTPTGRDW
ncbi:MAG: InlB B-repeat-containing protein [Opitutales bacterium]